MKPWWLSWILAVVAHVGVVGLIGLLFILLSLLGITLLTFDRPTHFKDIEFHLVTAPNEAPRNPNTRNRAEHNTRAGGKKIPHLREAQPQQQAGTPKPKSKPQPQQAQHSSTRPTVAKQPVQPQTKPQQPAPQPKQHATPTPPRPRVTAPKPSTTPRSVTALPNPLAPVHVPDAPGPVADTGPIMRHTPGASGHTGTTGGSGTAGPSTVPGQFSNTGRPGGGPSGQGGTGNYSQYGSPGGGGGRPGIDAVAEPDFGPYLAELQRRIRRNWVPPEDKEDKTVVMMFTISRDGRLLNMLVQRSSGYANADGAARAAVERSAPFRPLPAEYRNSSINVEFTFDYNVFKGRSSGISRH
jgi:TonB family protein